MFTLVHCLIFTSVLCLNASIQGQAKIIKVLPSPKVLVDVHDPVNLTCVYESGGGVPVWYRNGADQCRAHRCITIRGEENTSVLILHLIRIARDQGNKYGCFLEEQGETTDVKIQREMAASVIITKNITEALENSTTSFQLELIGSPMPRMNCKSGNSTVLFCSSIQMKRIIYDDPARSCKSSNGHYELKSVKVQSRKVEFKIFNVTIERDNDTIFCTWSNTERNQTFSLQINVTEMKVMNSQSTEKPETQAVVQNRTIVIIGISIACVLLLVAVVAVGLFYHQRERKLRNKYEKFLKSSHLIDPAKPLNEQMHNLTYEKSWEFPSKLLVINEKLGSGSFGNVFFGEAYAINLLQPRDQSNQAKKQRKLLRRISINHSNNNKSTTSSFAVAIKRCKDDASLEGIRDFVGELKLMMYIGEHKNIVNLLGISNREYQLYGILEYCPYGDLYEFLHTKRSTFEMSWEKTNFEQSVKFTLADQVAIARDISEAMRFLTLQKCIHRDLAARNILLGERFVVKVADFGIARKMDENYVYISSPQRLLPAKWMAPESLTDIIFTKETDLWSYGVVLWELTTLGGLPYVNMNLDEMKQFLFSGKRMEQPKHCINELYEVMLDTWNAKPKERPSFENIHERLTDLLTNKGVENASQSNENLRKREIDNEPSGSLGHQYINMEVQESFL